MKLSNTIAIFIASVSASASTSMVRAEDEPKLAPYMIAMPFYSEEYLKTLSEEDLHEAIKPQVIPFGANDEEGNEAGLEVLQNDVGNGRLPYGFAPNDPRNAFYNSREENKVTFGVKNNFCTTTACADLPEEVQSYWFHYGQTAWFDNAKCDVTNPFVTVGVDQSKPGIVEKQLNTGIFDISLYEADIMSVGFRTSAEFSYFQENPRVLGVVFRFTWVTDIDGDGREDLALVEIYYNADRVWTKETEPSLVDEKISFPVVATHEAGHSIGLSHFGTISRQTKGVKGGVTSLKVAPKGIMNALYSPMLALPLEFSGNDVRPICDLYGDWPAN